MIVRGPRPTERFYLLRREIAEDRRLSWAARGMLVHLLVKPDSWRVSVQALVNETADAGLSSGRDAVYRILRELQDAGYLSRGQTKSEGGSFEAMDYIVSEIPNAPLTENPEAAPRPGLPLTGLPCTADPIQASTKSKQGLRKAASGADAPIVDLLGNEINEQSKASGNDLQCPVDQIVATYHELMPDNPRVKVLHDGRRKAIAARWREASKLDCKPFGYSTVEAGLNAWRAFFTVCAQSEFLTGKARPKPGYKRFRADIDFLTSPQAFAKCLEGKYQQDAEEQQDGSWSASREGIEAKASELGIVPKVGESYSSLRDRCEAELRRPCQDRPSRATTGGRYEHARQGSEPHRHGAPR
ncbi:Uncharacterised protein [Burkholderia pseudomallei]|uniref:hypothetical protein n=2 Tax=Burkholderia pseudomallei TaxID=28450 RepID=UPI00016ABAD9|nr:hypothetical protein [Burkholderia pseudomallei]MCE2031828.1 hypothetical protein [Burkholderia pseudomallei CS]MCE2043962.1 hypothetical protein [Burkholderia pseudomallei OS]AIO85210.1 hypothetical protein DP46_407 [Burkholderia pseudomallei]AIP48211.1 hypothetical protein DR56_3335 [Burkholderia pseudomallei MSHR5858]AIP59947.1 hypothetical protein DR54_994 [Burkholderia pseudomallei HBPUB10303a]